MVENFWQDKRVIVTGGGGFLGSFVIEKLKQRGATDIFIPRVDNYNLVDPNAVRRLYADTLKDVDPKNVVVIHLAANVGGIGANRVRGEIPYNVANRKINGAHEASCCVSRNSSEAIFVSAYKDWGFKGESSVTGLPSGDSP